MERQITIGQNAAAAAAAQDNNWKTPAETLEARSGGRDSVARRPGKRKTGVTGCGGGGGGGGGGGSRVVSGTAPVKYEAAKVASSLGLQGPAAPIGAQLLQATGAGGGAAVNPEDLLHHRHASPTVYHANLLAGSSGNVQAALQQPAAAAALLSSLGNPAAALASMQAEASSLDLQAMQSMEWLFKKERFYLLVQFWQQVSQHMPTHTRLSLPCLMSIPQPSRDPF